MIKQSIFIISIPLTAALLTGCARNISSDVYSESHVGETSRTYRGTVINVRQVQVSPESLGENIVGAGAGAIGGGLAGSHIGGGKGNIAATAAGAIAGGLAGAYAEKMIKTQDALEYSIELTNGEIRTIVQGPSPSFAVGQPVLLIASSKGRSRIVSDHAGR
jgi:outer membrane lipoprotein SlyB